MNYLFIILLILLIPQVYDLVKTRRQESARAWENGFKKLEVEKDPGQESFYLTGADGFDTYVRLFEPARPKAVVQLVHGMSEHSGNYLDFASYLQAQGYTVAIHDHRGHGKSLSEKYPKGHMERASELVADTAKLTHYLKDQNPDLPVYLLGHSMGSMVTRAYLQDQDDQIDKLILTGTPPPDPLAPLGLFLARLACFYVGAYQRSRVINLIVGNKGGSLDFISYNEENRQVKSQDPLRIFHFSLGYTKTLIEINRILSQKSKYKLKNQDLKIYNLVGEDDQITKGPKGVQTSLKSLKNLGYKNIESKVYPQMRHEILNEEAKGQVYEDILEILEG